jgi:hypothetical protein
MSNATSSFVLETDATNLPYRSMKAEPKPDTVAAPSKIIMGLPERNAAPYPPTSHTLAYSSGSMSATFLVLRSFLLWKRFSSRPVLTKSFGLCAAELSDRIATN